MRVSVAASHSFFPSCLELPPPPCYFCGCRVAEDMFTRDDVEDIFEFLIVQVKVCHVSIHVLFLVKLMSEMGRRGAWGEGRLEVTPSCQLICPASLPPRRSV